MATCGTYQHAKLHAGLQAPSVSQIPVTDVKAHASIQDLGCPQLLILIIVLMTCPLHTFSLSQWFSACGLQPHRDHTSDIVYARHFHYD